MTGNLIFNDVIISGELVLNEPVINMSMAETIKGGFNYKLPFMLARGQNKRFKLG